MAEIAADGSLEFYGFIDRSLLLIEMHCVRCADPRPVSSFGLYERATPEPSQVPEPR
jgi:hypothetical protein